MTEAPLLDPLIGAVVAGRYHVERRLAAGGMGVVYIARQEPLGRKVALKVIRGDAQDPVAQQRFEREARAASSLQDPHVVVVHDFGVIDGGAAHGGLFLAMELLDGETLRQRLSGAPLSWGQSVVLVRQVAQALAAAHTRGVVHRDLKPENIMLGKSDGGSERCKVLDFGLAKGTGTAALVDSGKNLTRSGGFVGTPGYISPEVIDGAAEDPRQDVYALGVIWWELLSGRHPFPAETPMKTLVRQMHEDAPAIDPVVRQLAKIPEEGANLVVELMARDPARRPKDGVTVLARLDALRDTAGIVGAPPALIDSNADTIAGARSSVPRGSPFASSPPPSSPPSAPSSPTSVLALPDVDGSGEALTVEGRRRSPATPTSAPSRVAVVAAPGESTGMTGTVSGPGRRRRLKLRQQLFAGLIGASVVGTVVGVVAMRALEATPLALVSPPEPDTVDATPVVVVPPAITTTEVVFDGVPGMLGLKQLRDRLPTHILRLYRSGHAELLVPGDVSGDVADRLQGVVVTLDAAVEGAPATRHEVEVQEIKDGRITVLLKPLVDDAPLVFEDAGVADVEGGLAP